MAKRYHSDREFLAYAAASALAIGNHMHNRMADHEYHGPNDVRWIALAKERAERARDAILALDSALSLLED